MEDKTNSAKIDQFLQILQTLLGDLRKNITSEVNANIDKTLVEMMSANKKGEGLSNDKLEKLIDILLKEQANTKNENVKRSIRQVVKISYQQMDKLSTMVSEQKKSNKQQSFFHKMMEGFGKKQQKSNIKRDSILSKISKKTVASFKAFDNYNKLLEKSASNLIANSALLPARVAKSALMGMEPLLSKDVHKLTASLSFYQDNLEFRATAMEHAMEFTETSVKYLAEKTLPKMQEAVAGAASLVDDLTVNSLSSFKAVFDTLPDPLRKVVDFFNRVGNSALDLSKSFLKANYEVAKRVTAYLSRGMRGIRDFFTPKALKGIFSFSGPASNADEFFANNEVSFSKLFDNVDTMNTNIFSLAKGNPILAKSIDTLGSRLTSMPATFAKNIIHILNPVTWAKTLAKSLKFLAFSGLGSAILLPKTVRRNVLTAVRSKLPKDAQGSFIKAFAMAKDGLGNYFASMKHIFGGKFSKYLMPLASMIKKFDPGIMPLMLKKYGKGILTNFFTDVNNKGLLAGSLSFLAKGALKGFGTVFQKVLGLSGKGILGGAKGIWDLIRHPIKTIGGFFGVNKEKKKENADIADQIEKSIENQEGFFQTFWAQITRHIDKVYGGPKNAKGVPTDEKTIKEWWAEMTAASHESLNIVLGRDVADALRDGSNKVYDEATKYYNQAVTSLNELYDYTKNHYKQWLKDTEKFWKPVYEQWQKYENWYDELYKKNTEKAEAWHKTITEEWARLKEKYVVFEKIDAGFQAVSKAFNTTLDSTKDYFEELKKRASEKVTMDDVFYKENMTLGEMTAHKNVLTIKAFIETLGSDIKKTFTSPDFFKKAADFTGIHVEWDTVKESFKEAVKKVTDIDRESFKQGLKDLQIDVISALEAGTKAMANKVMSINLPFAPLIDAQTALVGKLADFLVYLKTLYPKENTPLLLTHEETPHFAAGGIVSKRTLATIGEEGPEAVLPLKATPAIKRIIDLIGRSVAFYVKPLLKTIASHLKSMNVSSTSIATSSESMLKEAKKTQEVIEEQANQASIIAQNNQRLALTTTASTTKALTDQSKKLLALPNPNKVKESSLADRITESIHKKGLIGSVKDYISGLYDKGKKRAIGYGVNKVLPLARKYGTPMLEGASKKLAGGGRISRELSTFLSEAADKLNGRKKPLLLTHEGTPHLAAGGIVKRKTLATIGEAGPEVILPLKITDPMKRIIDLIGRSVAFYVNPVLKSIDTAIKALGRLAMQTFANGEGGVAGMAGGAGMQVKAGATNTRAANLTAAANTAAANAGKRAPLANRMTNAIHKKGIVGSVKDYASGLVDQGKKKVIGYAVNKGLSAATKYGTPLLESAATKLAGGGKISRGLSSFLNIGVDVLKEVQHDQNTENEEELQSQNEAQTGALTTGLETRADMLNKKEEHEATRATITEAGDVADIKGILKSKKYCCDGSGDGGGITNTLSNILSGIKTFLITAGIDTAEVAPLALGANAAGAKKSLLKRASEYKDKKLTQAGEFIDKKTKGTFLEKPVAKVKTIGKNVGEKLETGFGKVKSFGKNVGEKLETGFGKVKVIGKNAKGFLDSGWDMLKTAGGKVKNTFNNIKGNKWVKRGTNLVTDTAGSVISTLAKGEAAISEAVATKGGAFFAKHPGISKFLTKGSEGIAKILKGAAKYGEKALDIGKKYGGKLVKGGAWLAEKLAAPGRAFARWLLKLAGFTPNGKGFAKLLKYVTEKAGAFKDLIMKIGIKPVLSLIQKLGTHVFGGLVDATITLVSDLWHGKSFTKSAFHAALSGGSYALGSMVGTGVATGITLLPPLAPLLPLLEGWVPELGGILGGMGAQWVTDKASDYIYDLGVKKGWIHAPKKGEIGDKISLDNKTVKATTAKMDMKNVGAKTAEATGGEMKLPSAGGIEPDLSVLKTAGGGAVVAGATVAGVTPTKVTNMPTTAAPAGNKVATLNFAEQRKQVEANHAKANKEVAETHAKAVNNLASEVSKNTTSNQTANNVSSSSSVNNISNNSTGVTQILTPQDIQAQMLLKGA